MKKPHYRQLGQGERDRIAALLAAGHQQKEVAAVLGRDPSTISREVNRNRRRRRNNNIITRGRYEATLAHHKAYLRRKYAKYQGRKINENDDLRHYIIEKLKDHWSPDDISGTLKREGGAFYASKNVIYGWLYSVWGQPWCQHLYSQRHQPKRRKGKKTKKTLIPKRIGIELRPQDVNDRLVFGHYEGDTIVSGKVHHSQTALAVAYERKAKYITAEKIAGLKPTLFNQAIKKMTRSVEMKSLTLDNGLENRYHEALGFATYFCDAYSSWQKGGVEHANKMIRWFIPKGSDIARYSDHYIQDMVTILNNKPRKSLGYQTPYEVMVEHDLFLKTKPQ